MKKNLLLIVAIVGLAVLPFFIQKGASFGGADDKAVKTITKIAPQYQRWFKPLWQPPSSEIESLLFALQAALGAGFIGYFIGYSKGKKSKEEHSHVEH